MPNGLSSAAEVAVLVIDEALPVVLRHLAHGDRLVVGVGDVVAEVDGLARVVDVALAIEARVEGADEAAARIVDGGREPALGVVVQLVGERVVADDAADRRQHVDQQQGEGEIDDAGAGDVAQRAEARVEGNAVQKDMQNTERQERQ